MQRTGTCPLAGTPSEVLGDIPQRPSASSPNSQVGKDDIGQRLWQPDLRPRTDQGEQAVPGKRRYPVGGFKPVMLFGAEAGRLVGVQPLSVAGRGEHGQPKRVTLLELGEVPVLADGPLAETRPFRRRCAFPLPCRLALLLGRGLTLAPVSHLGLSLGRGL